MGANWEERIKDFWANADDADAAGTLAAMRGLVEERPGDDAAAVYEWASGHDFLGRESEAIPLYERALELGLDDARRSQAWVQLASSLRNVGRPDEAIRLLEGFPGDGIIGDAPDAFRALALFDAGRPGEALRVALAALAKTLPLYGGAVRRYADDLPSGATSSH
ncbi:tetratricopeptide repeat protein [Arthrobacter silvisoli]|uniref:tetratricopeptide repeat protein n=1 Tax=Arthrobacter silvisoli TaxID=2291022 RepID=UPI001FEC5F56|nr:tetratricopeptide repeat protein [Arthrobacter silvisoli]